MATDRSTFDYSRLQETNDAFMLRYSARQQRNDPWTIKNMLPFALRLYLQRGALQEASELSRIEAHQTLTFPAGKFQDGDVLITVITKGALPGILPLPFLETMTFNSAIKNITLAAVTYNHSSGGAGQYLTKQPGPDMPGVWIVNKMNAPLNIFYQGNLVAQVYTDDGMSYMGGSASSVWFTNDRDGLKFGDELGFSFSIPGWEDRIIFTVTLDDNFIQTIRVGTVTAGMVGPPPDTYAYSVDQPVWTGITYYRPVGGYESRATNPLAPF